MKMKVNESLFTMTSLERLVTSMLSADGAHSASVRTYAYRTSTDAVHLNVVDNTTNEKSVQMANKIYDYLIKGIFACE